MVCGTRNSHFNSESRWNVKPGVQQKNVKSHDGVEAKTHEAGQSYKCAVLQDCRELFTFDLFGRSFYRLSAEERRIIQNASKTVWL